MPCEHFDGMWVAPLLDHLAALLIKFAVLADDEVDEMLKRGEEEY